MMISHFLSTEARFQIPLEYDQMLLTAAQNSGYSKNDIYRLAVEQFLDEHGMLKSGPLLYPHGYIVMSERKKLFAGKEA